MIWGYGVSGAHWLSLNSIVTRVLSLSLSLSLWDIGTDLFNNFRGSCSSTCKATFNFKFLSWLFLVGSLDRWWFLFSTKFLAFPFQSHFCYLPLPFLMQFCDFVPFFVVVISQYHEWLQSSRHNWMFVHNSSTIFKSYLMKRNERINTKGIHYVNGACASIPKCYTELI